ncbi:sulfotransferase family protein [Paracoccus shanxieyensis]|uniref:Sulfotransferase n=1 Tax=Paracoccus shanxieyensis TaxID=2675752 RepID=A0A6L6IT31_9RHOB|nr:sulfotransferase [Paracoccus shanxieyensis]MTH63333.1 sulfotransferase [Paracoccus shanxieyensis]MTH87247.1 sulfotransferase [Paracoccus shanxieyensis]
MNWNPDGKPRKPDFLGIGAQKAGTTWLSQMLGQHPDVWTPPFKEVQFFNHRFVEEHRKWLPWHFKRARQNIEKRYETRGEELPRDMAKYLSRITREPMFTNHWYKLVFAPAPDDAKTIDVTPEYSTLPPEGVEFVSKFLPDAKFIYIIRHPVDRAISQMKMNLTRARRKPASVEEWLTEVRDPVLLDRGDYQTYVPRWNAHFGADRLLYLPFGMISRDPIGFLRQVEGFLGLKPHDYRDVGKKVFASDNSLVVPDAARKALREMLEPQFAFVDQTFGKEFSAQFR